jgi:hypothetical protein
MKRSGRSGFHLFFMDSAQWAIYTLTVGFYAGFFGKPFNRQLPSKLLTGA